MTNGGIITRYKKKRSTKIDMLNGPLAGKIILFSLPIAASSILQQLFNSADLAVVGRFDSSAAMAAVGSTVPLINLIVGLFMGFSIGINVMIASLIGSENYDEINDAEHTGIMLSIVSGIVVLAVGEIFSPILLRYMDTPDSLMPMAELYLRILFCAVPFMLVYDFGASVLRGSGDSTRPLYALTASGIINVILNVIFVAGFKLGVAGVAIATVIANIISASLVLGFLIGEEDEFHFSFKNLRIHREYLKQILTIGVPAGLQFVVFSISNVVIQTGINGFGSDAIAGSTAAQNFEYIVYFVISAFAQAATTFTSANFAAMNRERCRTVYRDALTIGMASAFAIGLIFFIGRWQFLRIFSTESGVLAYAVIRMGMVTLFDGMTGTYEIPGGCLRGMQHSTAPMIITILGSCVFRLIWIATIFQMEQFHTFEMLCIVYLISWIITGITMNIAYFRYRRIEFKKIDDNCQKAAAENHISV